MENWIERNEYVAVVQELALIEYQLREMYWNGGAIGSFASDVLWEQFGVTP